MALAELFLILQVVFLTTLFYLLASSEHQYKPVELFSSLSPSMGNMEDIKFGKAFQDAIGLIFHII